MSTAVHNLGLSDVAVIVATRNEGAHLQECIESILKAAKGISEVIFVNDGSTDNSSDILKSFESKIQIVEEKGRGPGRARNMGVSHTDKKYLAFTDGDCVVAQNWLEKLVDGMKGKEKIFSSVGGAQKIYRNAEQTERNVGEFLESVGFVSDYIHQKKEVKTVMHNPTCNVLYDREAFLKANGFDETLWPCEDLDLDLRLKKLGYKALYQPEAIVEHRRPRTYLGFFKMMRRYGFAHTQLVKKRGLCQPIHILPFVPFILGGILSLIPEVALCFSLFWPIVYFATKTRSLKKSFLYTGLLFGAVLVWITGFYVGLFSKRKIAAQS